MGMSIPSAGLCQPKTSFFRLGSRYWNMAAPCSWAGGPLLALFREPGQGHHPRLDVMEFPVIHLPLAVLALGEGVHQPRPVEDLLRRVRVAGVDGLGGDLVGAHEVDQDLR